MLGTGIIAFGLKRLGYPVVCLVLGLILGPLVEANFHRSLGIEFGSWLIFIHRPATAVIFGLTILFVFFPYILTLLQLLTNRLFRPEKMQALKTSSNTSATQPLPKWREFAFLGLIVLGSLMFLFQSHTYSYAVKLFPVLILWVLIAVSVWRLIRLGLVRILLKKRAQASTAVDTAQQVKSGLMWYWSVLALIGYAALTWLLGMIAATPVYTFILPRVMGYRRWPIIATTAAGVTVFLVFISRVFNLILPKGILF
jgi:hypothetical protein